MVEMLTKGQMAHVGWCRIKEGDTRGNDDSPAHHNGRDDGRGRHRRLVVGVQEDGRGATAQPTDRLLLAVRQVRRQPGAGRLAAALRRGGSRQLRHHRAHRRHRAFRARPESPLRDLCHSADQGGDHRRAPVHRLGPAFGAHQGSGRRAGLYASRSDVATHAERHRGGGRARDVGGRLPQGVAQDLHGGHGRPRRGPARRGALRALDPGRDPAGQVVWPGGHLRGQGVQGGADLRRRRHARAGADRLDDVLLRRSHVDRDRPGPRGDREQGVSDPHQGAAPAAFEARRPAGAGVAQAGRRHPERQADAGKAEPGKADPAATERGRLQLLAS